MVDITAALAGGGPAVNELQVASTSGTDSIRVTDAGGVASNVSIANPIVLVKTTASATSNGATWTLNSGSSGYATFGPAPADAGLVKGVWLYTLANTGNNEVLVSQPGPAAFAAGLVGTAAQTIWLSLIHI